MIDESIDEKKSRIKKKKFFVQCVNPKLIEVNLLFVVYKIYFVSSCGWFTAQSGLIIINFN